MKKTQNKWVRKGVVNDMNAHFYVLLSVSICSVIVVNVDQLSVKIYCHFKLISLKSYLSLVYLYRYHVVWEI